MHPKEHDNLPSPRGMNELKRLFGANNVSEEFEVFPVLGRSNKEWCYVVSIKPDNDILSHIPETGNDFTWLVTDIESKLCDILTIPSCMDNHVGSMEDGLQLVSDNELRRLIIPVSIVEEDESIDALSKMHPDHFKQDIERTQIDDYTLWLRRASHGIRWEFAQDQQGSYFHTTTKLTRNPRELELAICAAVGVDDDCLMEKKEGCARIPLSVMQAPKAVMLSEHPLPTAYMKQVKAMSDDSLSRH